MNAHPPTAVHALPRRQPDASLRWLRLLGSACLLGLLLGLWSLPAHATLVVQMSDTQLVKRSSLIVRATVISQRSSWTPKRIAIITQVKLRVHEELLQRRAPATLVIGHYGGQVGKTRMESHGGPRFSVGQEVVVFLYRKTQLPQGEYLLTGWSQGRWDVLRPKSNTASQAPLVRRTLPGLRLYAPKQKRVTFAKPKQETLSQFRIRLRQLWQGLKQGKGKRR